MSQPSRAAAIDLVRGLVMVLMVLDHARDFFCGFGDPTDLETTTPLLFFTRWITHFCAPGFVLLAGAAAFLYGRNRTPKERFHFLWTRGLWLVVLELTIVRFAWVPDPTYSFTFVQVIWAIGWSMLLLAPMSWLPPRFVAAIGLTIVMLHNTLDGIHADDLGQWGLPWAILHERVDHTYELLPGHEVYIGYPLLAWIGVMASGFGLGELLASEPRTRQRWLLRLGIVITILFVEIRWLNIYGDPERWSAQRDWVYTLMAFLNCEKYPPSLDYLLMTIGPLLILLWAFDRWPPRWLRPLEIFGRVPLFFYVAHLYLLRIPAGILAIRRWGIDHLLEHDGSPGYSLEWAYAAWAIAILILYPACLWFAGVKERRSAQWWWLRYL